MGHQVLILSRDWKTLPKCDEIYHLAAYGNMYNHKDEQEIFKVNVVNTWRLLQASQKLSYQKFIYVSTSSVNLDIPTVYSSTKKSAEALCQYFPKVAIIRPYSIIGVGEQKEHLIPTLIDAAYTGKLIPFVPWPTHDFIDVEDVVSAMIVIDKASIYNIGSGISYSNQDVLRIVEQVTGKKINIKQVESLRSYDNKTWKSPDKWNHKFLPGIISEMVDDYVKQSS